MYTYSYTAVLEYGTRESSTCYVPYTWLLRSGTVGTGVINERMITDQNSDHAIMDLPQFSFITPLHASTLEYVPAGTEYYRGGALGSGI